LAKSTHIFRHPQSALLKRKKKLKLASNTESVTQAYYGTWILENPVHEVPAGVAGFTG